LIRYWQGLASLILTPPA